MITSEQSSAFEAWLNACRAHNEIVRRFRRAKSERDAIRHKLTGAATEVLDELLTARKTAHTEVEDLYGQLERTRFVRFERLKDLERAFLGEDYV